MQQHIDEWSLLREPDTSAEGRLWDWFRSYIQDHGEPHELGMVVAVSQAQKMARSAGHNPQRLTPCVKAHGGTSKPSGFSGEYVYTVPASVLNFGDPPVSSV